MMKPCLGFQQLRLIFGFTVSLMVIAGYASASPLCSQVLMKTASSMKVSENIMQSTLKDLAQLRLEIDQAAAQGQQGARSLSVKKSVFTSKYAEFVKALSKTHTEKQITELMKQEIAHLQGREREADAIVKADRATQAKAFNVYNSDYKLTDTITLNSRPSDINGVVLDSMEYVPKNDSLFIVTETNDRNMAKSFELINLKTKDATTLWSQAEGSLLAKKFSSNREHFIALTTTPDMRGEFFIYDLKNDVARKMNVPDEVVYNPADRNDIFLFDITPSGKSAILMHGKRSNNRAFMIDLETGEVRELYTLGKKITGHRLQIQFISETEFLSVQLNFMKPELYVTDVALEHDTQLLPFKMNYLKLAITPDLATVYLHNGRSGSTALASINTAELLAPKPELHITPHGESITFDLKALPNGGVFINQHAMTRGGEVDIVSGIGRNKDIAVGELTMPMVVEENRPLRGITATPKGDRIFLQYYDRETYKTIIEIRDQP